MMSLDGQYFDKIVLGEDLFRIDPFSQRLVQVDHERNVLPYKHMVQSSDYFCMAYNKKEKTIAPGGFADGMHTQDYTAISVPTSLLFLKHRCNLREYSQINEQSSALMWGFQMLGLDYAERILGVTPRCKIDDQLYCFKLKDQTLGHSLFEPEVCLKDLRQLTTAQGQSYEALYNTKKKILENLEWKDVYPNHLIVRIPEIKALDPVGSALAEGKPPFHYLNRHPIRQDKIKLFSHRYATKEIALFPQTQDIRPIKATPDPRETKVSDYNAASGFGSPSAREPEKHVRRRKTGLSG